jgi:hypothetical protein
VVVTVQVAVATVQAVVVVAVQAAVAADNVVLLDQAVPDQVVQDNHHLITT